jgi:hypothetical protein
VGRKEKTQTREEGLGRAKKIWAGKKLAGLENQSWAGIQAAPVPSSSVQIEHGHDEKL